MRYLLDTSVLSELIKPVPYDGMLSFLRHIEPEDASLSVITIGEVVSGIESMPEGKRRRQYVAWLDEIEQQYAEKSFPSIST